MLPTANRLKNKKDFENVAQQGRKYFSNFFIIRIDKKPNPVPQVGVIISAKVAKRAVDRNRIKRWVSHDLREQLALLEPAKYVFIVKKQIVNAKHKEITNDLKNFLKNQK